MARPWRVKLHHIYREANYCVDLYAKEGQKANVVLVSLLKFQISCYRPLRMMFMGFIIPV